MHMYVCMHNIDVTSTLFMYHLDIIQSIYIYVCICMYACIPCVFIPEFVGAAHAE
jgi:hypothetical protein